MIRKSDFKGIVELSEHIRIEQLGQHIKNADDLDLKGLIGLNRYNTFYVDYKKRKQVVSIQAGASTILTLNSTSDISELDCVYLEGFSGNGANALHAEKLNNKRFKYEVINSTQIKILEIIEEITFNDVYFAEIDSTHWNIEGGIATNFCKFEYFTLLRNYLCVDSYIRWASVSAITNSEAGLVEKRLDFSQQPTPQTVGILIARYKQDLEVYKARILDYLKANTSEKTRKKSKLFVGVIVPSKPFTTTNKRDVE
jgi:hypothetical protein